MSYLDLLDHGVRIQEAKRNRPYNDIFGNVTIGIGRNLTSRGMSDDEVEYLFANDKRGAERAARSLVPTFDDLSDIRKYVLCDMAFNLGQNRLAEFQRFLLAIHEQRFADAATEMRASLWFKQVKGRGVLLSNAMETDTL